MHWLKITAIRVLLALACFLYLCEWAPFLFGQEANTPPDILMVNELHCVIEKQQKTWQTTCTASYGNHENYHREPFVAHFPPRKSEPAANKDADQWITKVNKLQAVTKPVSVNDLKEKK